MSPFTAAKDRTKKFDLYQKHRVKEYWIVHATEQYLEIFILNEKHEYDKPNVFIRGGDKLITPILEGLEIDIDEVFE